MKVCFIIPAFADGGAQKQCVHLLNELQTRADLELSLIRFHTGGVHDGLLRTERLSVFDMPSRSNFDFRNVLAAAEITRQIKPDILISWLHAADVYSYFIRMMNGELKWIMTERDSRYPNKFRYWLRAKLGRHADAIISNSASGDALWAELRARGPRYVVGNIVTAAPMQSAAQPRQRCVVHVGRLEEQKNVLVVAHAFCRLASRRPDLSFAFVGDGSLRGEVERIAVEAQLSSKIKVLGFRQDAQSFIERAAVLVTLSHHEGMPNVMLEAVAAETPIVASRIRQHEDLLGSGFPFYVKDSDDPSAVADQIEAALDATDFRGHLAEAKSRLAQMTPQTIASRYVEIFHSTIEATP